MYAGGTRPYNGPMTSTTAAPAPSASTTSTTSPGPRFAAAGVLLEWLATGTFDQPTDALEPGATLQALLPRGFCDWEGREAVCGAFDRFFGGFDEFEIIDATIGQVGDRLQLRWRLHVRGGRLGPEDFVVEQSCYADTGPTGRLQHLALVCSGFRKEHRDA